MGFLDLFRKKTSTATEEKQVELPNVVADDKVDDILNQEILEFFPKDGTWWSCCFNRPKEIEKDNLPCHLREHDWMSKLLHQNLLEKKIYISASKIKAFMDASETFAKLRHNYELEIVRWQINFIKNNGENWVIPKGYDDASFLYVTDAEEFFRGGVVETLRAIGMDKEVIEEGLEKYADLWREGYINLSFINAFEPSNFLRDPIKPADENHKENWLRLRRYEYYTDHKDSVDKYGEVTPDMQLHGEQLSQLKKTVAKQNAAREKEIKIWEENPVYKKNIFKDIYGMER